MGLRPGQIEIWFESNKVSPELESDNTKLMSGTNDFNARTIAEFRSNHGKVGGMFEGAHVCGYRGAGNRN